MRIKLHNIKALYASYDPEIEFLNGWNEMPSIYRELKDFLQSYTSSPENSAQELNSIQIVQLLQILFNNKISNRTSEALNSLENLFELSPALMQILKLAHQYNLLDVNRFEFLKATQELAEEWIILWAHLVKYELDHFDNFCLLCENIQYIPSINITLAHSKSKLTQTLLLYHFQKEIELACCQYYLNYFNVSLSEMQIAILYQHKTALNDLINCFYYFKLAEIKLFQSQLDALCQYFQLLPICVRALFYLTKMKLPFTDAHLDLICNNYNHVVLLEKVLAYIDKTGFMLKEEQFNIFFEKTENLGNIVQILNFVNAHNLILLKEEVDCLINNMIFIPGLQLCLTSLRLAHVQIERSEFTFLCVNLQKTALIGLRLNQLLKEGHLNRSTFCMVCWEIHGYNLFPLMSNPFLFFNGNSPESTAHLESTLSMGF